MRATGPTLVLLLLFLSTAVAASDGDAPETEPEMIERFEVERRERDSDDDELQTLRFLRANRAYLRAELDRLLSERRLVEGDARALSDRDRALLAHGAALAADRDTLARAQGELDRQELMRSVSELVDHEGALDEIEALLRAQSERLARLEADYVGRQETAVALFLRGPLAEDTAEILVEDPRGDRRRIALDHQARRSLREGASTQLFHDFVEPRPLEYVVSRVDEEGEIEEIGRLSLRPTRDRLTLVEIDAPATREAEAGLQTVIWER